MNYFVASANNLIDGNECLKITTPPFWEIFVEIINFLFCKAIPAIKFQNLLFLNDLPLYVMKNV